MDNNEHIKTGSAFAIYHREHGFLKPKGGWSHDVAAMRLYDKYHHAVACQRFHSSDAVVVEVNVQVNLENVFASVIQGPEPYKNKKK